MNGPVGTGVLYQASPASLLAAVVTVSTLAVMLGVTLVPLNVQFALLKPETRTLPLGAAFAGAPEASRIWLPAVPRPAPVKLITPPLPGRRVREARVRELVPLVPGTELNVDVPEPTVTAPRVALDVPLLPPK